MLLHQGDGTSSNISTAAAVDASAAIGGAVGGAVFLILLIIALFILLRCVIISRKKKKTKYFDDRVHFSATSQDSTLSHNPRYLTEFPNIAGEADLNAEARICKFNLLYVHTYVCICN